MFTCYLQQSRERAMHKELTAAVVALLCLILVREGSPTQCHSAEGRPVLCAFCSDQYAAVRWNASAEVVDRIEVYYICHYPNGSEVPYHASNCYGRDKRLDEGHTLASLGLGYITRTHAIDIRFGTGADCTFRGVYYEQQNTGQYHFLTEQSCVIKTAAECGQDTDSCLLPIACNGTEVGNCDCQCSEGFAGDGCTADFPAAFPTAFPTPTPHQVEISLVTTQPPMPSIQAISSGLPLMQLITSSSAVIHSNTNNTQTADKTSAVAVALITITAPLLLAISAVALICCIMAVRVKTKRFKTSDPFDITFSEKIDLDFEPVKADESIISAESVYSILQKLSFEDNFEVLDTRKSICSDSTSQTESLVLSDVDHVDQSAETVSFALESAAGTELASAYTSASVKPIAFDVQSHVRDNTSEYTTESEFKSAPTQRPSKTVSISQPIDASGYTAESALILATSISPELASPPSTQLPSKSLASNQPTNAIGYVTVPIAKPLHMHASGYVTDTAVLEETFPPGIAEATRLNVNPNCKVDPTASQEYTNRTASIIGSSYVTVPAHDSISSVVPQVECGTNPADCTLIDGLNTSQAEQRCVFKSSGYVTEQSLAQKSDYSERSAAFSIPFQSDTTCSSPNTMSITSSGGYFIESSTESDDRQEMRFDRRQTGYITDENTTDPLQMPLQFKSESTPDLELSEHDSKIEQRSGYITEAECDASQSQTRPKLTDFTTPNPTFTTEATHQLLAVEGSSNSVLGNQNLVESTTGTENPRFEVQAYSDNNFPSQHRSLPISVGGYITEDFAAII